LKLIVFLLSSPQAAGAIALLLSARPDLTWRDVQAIIAESSIQINPDDQDWTHNGGGYYHSHKYGFGLLSVEEMVMSLFLLVALCILIVI